MAIWAARTLQPIIVFYVAVIFLASMALTYFIFDSITGVKALAMAAFAAIVSLLPGLVSRVEYRLSRTGLDKRSLNEKKSQAFKNVFRFEQLSHIVPLKHGFKYYKTLKEPNVFKRFWKLYISNAHSGEIHLETKDRERILKLLADQGLKLK